MSSEPIIERIAQALEAVLRGVTVAAGYQIQVGDVIRPDRRGNYRAPMHLECVLGQESSRLAADQTCGLENWETDFAIDLCLRPSDGQGCYDTLANLGAADLRKALMVDRRLGGAIGVVDLTVGPPEKLTELEGSYGGIGITVTVAYRTAEGDPYRLPGE